MLAEVERGNASLDLEISAKHFCERKSLPTLKLLVSSMGKSIFEDIPRTMFPCIVAYGPDIARVSDAENLFM